MNSPVLFRRALGRDAGKLSAIAFAAKQHWGYPDDWMAEWRTELTVTPEYIINHPVFVVKQAGKIVGFFGLRLSENSWHLEHLWLRPACIGRGLGRKLFEEAARHVRTSGGSKLLIKSDPNAEPFYRKMGAVRSGEERYLLLGKFERELPLLTYTVRSDGKLRPVRT